MGHEQKSAKTFDSYLGASEASASTFQLTAAKPHQICS